MARAELHVESDRVIEQTLHGYHEGHQLLSASTRLKPKDAAVIDRLSDLSGFLPPGVRIPPYLTLYAVGAYLAVARTWPDKSGKRSGTVLTHTLLLPQEFVASRDDLEGVLALHREPADTNDRAAYKAALPFPPPASVAWRAVRRDERFAVVAALLFGRAERPVVLVDAHPDETILTRFWASLWPEARSRFAACTFALGVRATDRAFDLLVAPPAARPSFADASRTPVWCDLERVGVTPVAGVSDQAWFEFFLSDAPTWRRDLVAWASARKLPMPGIGYVARLERMRLLDEAANERITAARARLDALAALDVQLPSSHAYLREGVQALIRQQSSAADAPSPLRSLRDLVGREEVARVAGDDSSIRSALETMVRDEVDARAARDESNTLAELSELFGEARRARLRTAVVAGAVRSFQRLGGDEARHRWLNAVLRLQSVHLRSSIGLELLRLVPAPERIRIAEMVASALSERSRVAFIRAARRAALGLRDAPLVLHTYAASGSRTVGMRYAMAIILADETPATALPKLEALPPDLLADLALSEVEAQWRDIVIEHGPRWTRDGGISLADVAKRAAFLEHGTPLFVRRLAGEEESMATAFLREESPWATKIILESLTKDDDSAAPMIELALQQLPDADLSKPEFLQALQTEVDATSADRVMRRIAPFLVRAFVGEGVGPELRDFLAVPSWHRWVNARGAEGIRASLPALSWEATLPSSFRTLVALGPDYEASAAMLVVASIHAADRAALDKAVSAASSLFSGKADVSLARERLAAEMLIAVRSRIPPSAVKWIQACFMIAYAPTVGGRDVFEATQWRSRYWGWDAARDWREWLVITWWEKRWEAGAFLLTLRGDRKLLDDALEIIRYKGWKLEFVESLAEAAARNAKLNSWLPAIENWLEAFRPKKGWFW